MTFHGVGMDFFLELHNIIRGIQYASNVIYRLQPSVYYLMLFFKYLDYPIFDAF